MEPAAGVGVGRGVGVAMGRGVSVGLVPLEQAATNRIATKAKIGTVTRCFTKTLP